MANLYSQPLRVYMLLGVLGLMGIFCGLTLPISLFPASARPVVAVAIGYGGMTSSEFLDAYGEDFEGSLRGVYSKNAHVEQVESNYWDGNVTYYVRFTWGSDPDIAKKEVDSVISAWTGRFPADIHDQVWSWMSNDNSGYFVASFFSDKRTLDEVYELLDGALRARLSKIQDAELPSLWNPDRKEVTVELKPEAMASLQLVPRDISQAINQMLQSRRGGSVTVGLNQMRIEMPRVVRKPEDLNDIPILTPAGRIVHLSDVAKVDLRRNLGDTRIIKTSGAPSVTLYASPRPGGNIKRMAEQTLAAIDDAKKDLPDDIHYKVLVDPSQFIGSAIEHVLDEVAIGSLLAVVVLFVFIGSLRNVITAAVEIPLSIILAFILMKLTGVTINLISLGGLALSAGMNVDGSVVVMENIFRHLDEKRGRNLSAKERLHIVTQAVAEVRLPLIASTIASLVVFIPLMFTSALSYAILGDLAKAVVFSHGCSAVVALLLVPTVRLQLMGRPGAANSDHENSRFEPLLQAMERVYAAALKGFMRRKRLKWIAYPLLTAFLAALVIFVLPTLPLEVIGKPDSDMIFLSMNTKGHTVTKQMETQSDDVERDLLATYAGRIVYTFTRIDSANHATIIAKLQDKALMADMWADLESHFIDTPTTRYHVEPWNPSELPIPDPPALRVAIRGGDLASRRDVTLELSDLLQANHTFDRIYMTPNVERLKGVQLDVDADAWASLASSGARLTPEDLADMSRIATIGQRVTHMSVRSRQADIIMRYPHGTLAAPADLAAMPVGVAGKVVALKALLPLSIVEIDPPIYREDGQDLFLINGRQNIDNKSGQSDALAKAINTLKHWIDAHHGPNGNGKPVVAIEEADHDIKEAIREMGLAIVLSVLLILFVLILQFGSIIESLLVLIAVPLGFIGVVIALKLAHSTLSLNSALGVILLSGIAVNNSIMMVDFIRVLTAQGMAPREAALVAAKKRLRPILITSLTTILGMLPIALGLGQGGRILKPLGVAVSGGLWISMVLTLFLVPSLQVSYLEAKIKRRQRRSEHDHDRPWSAPESTKMEDLP